MNGEKKHNSSVVQSLSDEELKQLLLDVGFELDYGQPGQIIFDEADEFVLKCTISVGLLSQEQPTFVVLPTIRTACDLKVAC